MRLKIEFEGKGKELPVNYRHFIQGWIYSCLKDSKFSSFIHDRGYQGESKKFKLFVYSDLLGKFSVKDRTILFDSNIVLYIASEVPQLLESIYTHALYSQTILLDSCLLKILNLQLIEDRNFKDTRIIEFETISPVTAYRKVDNKFIYYSPDTKEFEELCFQNLHRKYQTCIGTKRNPLIFKNYEPIFFKKRISYFKSTFYVSYYLKFRAELNSTALQLLMNTGLSSKGSAGFGMVKILK